MFAANGLILFAFAFFPIRLLLFHLRDSEEKPGPLSIVGILLCTLLSLVYLTVLMGKNFFY